MGKHSSDGSPEDSGRCSVMNESSAGVGKQSLSQEFREFDFVSEKRAGDIDAFTSDDNNSLT